MNQTTSLLAQLNQSSPVQYALIDIQSVQVQYMFSFVVILVINFIVLYQMSMQIWRIYSQYQVQNIIHDVYDKIMLNLSIKYIVLNAICIIIFYDLTSPPVQIFKIFWLYGLVVIFMKFDIKEILMPALGVMTAILLIACLWMYFWTELPAFKLILMETSVIVYFGLTQVFRITKILNIFNKQNNKNMQLSVESLMQKNKMQKSLNEYDEFTTNLELDQHVIAHLQNRRSFCIVLSTVLIVNSILYFDLTAAKQLLGEVFLSILLDLLPLYILYWYLKKNSKQNQVLSQKSMQEQSNNYNQSVGRRTSKIVIQMVDLKR